MKIYWKVAIIALGAIAGYMYYYFIGCQGNHCPISSNPWISTGYGALIGVIFTLGNKKKNKDKSEGSE